MSFSLLLIVSLVPQLLALTCNKTPAGECIAPACGRTVVTNAVGVAFVSQYCSSNPYPTSTELRFCNDKDHCNDDATANTVAAGVLSRKCKCGGPKASSDCDVNGECTATVRPDSVDAAAGCVTKMFSSPALNYTVQGCTTVTKQNGSTDFTTSIVTSTCNTEKCN